MFKLVENRETGEVKLFHLKKSKNNQIKSEEIRYSTLSYKKNEFENTVSIDAIDVNGKQYKLDKCEWERIGQANYDLEPNDWITRNMGGKV